MYLLTNLCILVLLFRLRTPIPLADPAPIALPAAEASLGAGANPNLLDSLVRRLPKAGEKKEILISYLAAVPTLFGEIDQYLLNISASNSAQSSSSQDRESFSKKLNQIVRCLTTDAYVSVVSGALVAAIVEINEDRTILPDYQLKYLFGNTCGNDSYSTRLFMEHWQAGARVFIGPEKNCKTEASMAASQNLPIISYRCNDQDISRDDYHYRTFARTVPPSGEIFKAFLSLMKHNKWRKFSVIYDVKKGHAKNELFETLKRIMEEENRFEEKKFEIMNVSRLEFLKMDMSSVQDVKSIHDAVRTTMDTTRIYLTFDNVRLFRTLLFTMGEMGLIEKDYMLIYLDTNYDWLNVYHAMNNHFLRNTMTYLHHSWDANNSSDRKMLDYAQNALSIIPTPVKLNSQRFYNFWKTAGEYIHYFGVQKTDNLKGNRIACYLYDAVYLYARAVHELVEEFGDDKDYDPTADGKAIIDRIVNRKYKSIQGFDMRIDSKGNSKGNFTLLSWQKVVPVMNRSDAKYYPLDRALDLTAIFVEPSEKENGRLPVLDLKTARIHWRTGDGPPLDEPICGFHGEKCKKKINLMILIFGSFLFVTICSIVVSGFVYRSRKYEKELSMIWRIEPSEVQRMVNGNESTASLLADTNDFNPVNEDPWFNEAEMKGSGMRGVASYKGTLVAIKEIVFFRKTRDLTRSAKKELRLMRQLAHPNVNSFLGIIICPTSICTVREFCTKGSLMDILRNQDMKLDHLYIASFIEDLCKGMVYIHDSELRVHGNLKSTNCLITSRWALQIADYGMYEIRDNMHWDDKSGMWQNFLWTAPEVMTISGSLATRLPPTQKSDIFSCGIILHEIFTREGPYQLCVDRGDVHGNISGTGSDRFVKDEQFEKIVRRVYNDPTFRPDLKEVEAQNYVKETLASCWNYDAASRPDIKTLRNRLKPLSTHIYKRNIMDHMIIMMEKYQTQLEELVEERTIELREEQSRSQHLLQRMLPRSVADQLLAGQDVVPEAFPPVTIYFSDIVGFTRISGESTPMQVVAFLNKLYTLFDGIIRRYDVYKVETIGDAYMVVSGVPQYKTTQFHAEQLAMMALHVLSAVRCFVIPHRTKDQLMIRIGMHTGPCVAGVVGKTMPRYTLFGDTVNTASRMESNGEALRIHCSQTTKEALLQMSGFILEERGSMPIKGKGHMTTYWLNGRAGYDFTAETPDQPINETLEIFPRQNKFRGSNWGINRDSTLSLVDKGNAFSKRTIPARTTEAAYYQHQANGTGFALIGREMPRVSEDDAESMSKRKRSINGSRKYSSAMSSATEFGSMAMRKRSTSLPDGEKLNLDFLEVNLLNLTSCSNPSVPIATVAPLREKGRVGSSLSESPSQSQYPSYRDLSTPHQRKRGIATVFPIRKRSLSCGDASRPTSSVITNSCAVTASTSPKLADSPEDVVSSVQDDEKPLMVVDGHRSCPQRRRRTRPSFLRDPSPLARRIRDASPFSGARAFWNSRPDTRQRSRGDSITRMFRKWRGANEYSDLNDDDFGEGNSIEMSVRGKEDEKKESFSISSVALNTDQSELAPLTISS